METQTLVQPPPSPPVVAYRETTTKTGKTVRVGVLPTGEQVIPVRDLARAMGVAEITMNRLVARSLNPVQTITVGATGKRQVQALPLGEVAKVQARMAEREEITRQLGRCAPLNTTADQLRRMTKWRLCIDVAGRRITGDIPVVKRHDQYFFRLNELAQACGVSLINARYRLRVALRPCANHVAGTEPVYQELYRQGVRVRFGPEYVEENPLAPSQQRTGPGGHHATVWPVDLAPLMCRALLAARTPGRPPADQPHPGWWAPEPDDQSEAAHVADS